MVLLDKTGTLTLGFPSVQQVIPVGGHSTVEVLQLAASVEIFWEHPLAAAVLKARQQPYELLEASEFQYLVGRWCVRNGGRQAGAHRECRILCGARRGRKGSACHGFVARMAHR